jgi:intein/homing endonuclease
MSELLIKQMVEDGFSISRIAKSVDLPSNDVKNIIIKNDYKLLKECFDNSKIEKICELYKKGVSAKILGLKFSIDKRRIQRWAKENNINVRKLGEAQRVILWNEHCFDQVDTAEKAYFLGFCFADAYNSQSVNSFKIALKSDDVDHLKKFARLLSYPEEEVSTHINLIQKINTCNITLHSKYFCSQMAKLGCPQAKSLIIKYPIWMPDDLHVHFIRGLFDGDGSLTKRKNNEWKFSIAGTLDICNSIKKIINNKLNIQTAIYPPSSNVHEIQTNGNEKILKITNWLYFNSTPDMRLDRKFEKYKELKFQQENKQKKIIQ